MSLLNRLGFVFGLCVAAAQVLTTWGEGRPLIALVPYYLIAGWVVATPWLERPAFEHRLTAWSVALGFFYAEFTGPLIFFDRPPWVLTLAGGATIACVAGLVLAFVCAMLETRGLDSLVGKSADSS